MNPKRPVRKWERRWVLQPNVIEHGSVIWIQKWVCVENLDKVSLNGVPILEGPTKSGEALLPMQAPALIQFYDNSSSASGPDQNLEDLRPAKISTPIQPVSVPQRIEKSDGPEDNPDYDQFALPTANLFNQSISDLDIDAANKRTYTCPDDDCGKVFPDQGTGTLNLDFIGTYRKHQMTHGERLYICKQCGKKFLDNSKLKRHQLVHTVRPLITTHRHTGREALPLRGMRQEV